MLPPAFRPYLERFEASIKDDPRVLGVLYTGSLGRGTADHYADLDIEVWATDDAWEDPIATLNDLLGRLAPIQHMYERGEGFITGAVGDDWRRVDLYLKRKDDLEPRPDFAGATAVKDFNGALAQAVAASQPEEAVVTIEAARFAIHEAIDSQVYLALHNARGAVWSAISEVTYHVTALYALLALTRGRRSYGPRYVEQIATPEEQQVMAAVWPTAPTQAEVRRAARELWTWTRYVWAEAERTLGQSLGITIEEPSLLAAIDALYDSPPS